MQALFDTTDTHQSNQALDDPGSRLSATARVLWCVLLSLVAALLMVCLPAQADDSQAQSPCSVVSSQ